MQFFLQRHFFIIALVVGTLLNLINQGDVLLSSGELNHLKIAFTYCVPYLVASVSSWVTLRRIKVKEWVRN
ncbi:MAG: nitrate/nitrite transporter NrtS [Porticoccus sp.]